VSTFTDLLRGRKVVLYSDNKGATCLCIMLPVLGVCAFLPGAEHTTARGSAKAFDHNHIIHEVWTLAFQQSIHLWVERVPSKFNIGDSPSRGEHQILRDVGAQWRPPVLDSVQILPSV